MSGDIAMLKQALRVLQGVEDDLLHMNVVSEQASCGTAACLAGHICYDPWFRENTEIGKVKISSYGLVEVGGTLEAVRLVLGLSEEDGARLLAERAGLLDDPHAISKGEVEDNLLRLIAGKDAFEYQAVEDYDEDHDLDDDDQDLDEEDDCEDDDEVEDDEIDD